MRKILPIITAGFFLMPACKNHDKQRSELRSELRDKAMPYFIGKFKEEKAAFIIDSIIVLKVDSLNERRDSLHSFSQLNVMVTHQIALTKLQQETANNKLNQAQLMRNLDKALFEVYRDDATKEQEKVNSMLEISKGLSTRMKLISQKIEKGELDSVKQTGYILLFKLKAHDLQNVAREIDSMQMNFDLDKRIKLKEEFI